MLAKILDFAPALAFFLTYRITGNLIMATSVIITGCVLSFVLQYMLWRKTSRMQIFMTAMVLIFGLPTIFLQDPDFIKLKVTVVNWVLSTTIFVCQFVLRRNPFAYLFGREIPIPEHIWFKLGTYFMGFFVFMGALNLTIAFFLPTLFGIPEKMAESYWVDYKTFGTIILNCIFTFFIFFVVLRRHPEVLAAFKTVAKDKMSSDKNQDKMESAQESNEANLNATVAPATVEAALDPRDQNSNFDREFERNPNSER